MPTLTSTATTNYQYHSHGNEWGTCCTMMSSSTWCIPAHVTAWHVLSVFLLPWVSMSNSVSSVATNNQSTGKNGTHLLFVSPQSWMATTPLYLKPMCDFYSHQDHWDHTLMQAMKLDWPQSGLVPVQPLLTRTWTWITGPVPALARTSTWTSRSRFRRFGLGLKPGSCLKIFNKLRLHYCASQIHIEAPQIDI